MNKGLHIVSFVLLVVGGLNWGLVGLFNFDLVATILGGPGSVLTRIVYVLVGLGALVILFTHKGYCGVCKGSADMKKDGMKK
jgi:uncharacterized membrane protein YuzA (DUF378 family)